MVDVQVSAAVARTALRESGFSMLLNSGNAEHYIREGRHVVVHVDGDAVSHFENVNVQRAGKMVSFLFDGMRSEIFSVRDES